MKISLVVVGKTQTKDLQESVLDYSKRISRYSGFDMIDTSDEKLAKTLDKFDRIFLLDEKGKEYTSMEFSGFIEKQLNAGVKNIAFVVGGPFGFSEEVRALADSSLALSKMTFPHDLVRVIFLEQLYRAFSILRNEKYHHE
jgi:23S rRNA (pseudouridine1915-N3)-methyltransferase